METILIIIYTILAFFGIKYLFKGKTISGINDKYRDRDKPLSIDSARIGADINRIKKEIAEKEIGRTLTPDEVEKYWQENG